MYKTKNKNVCFWCGKPTGEEVVISQSPIVNLPETGHGVYSYDPCPECQKHMDEGVTFMETEKLPVYGDHKPIMGGVYPTGNWMVTSTAEAEKYFHGNTRKYIFLRPLDFEWLIDKLEGVVIDVS